MKTEKTVVVKVLTSDGVELEGKEIVNFVAGGKEYIGAFFGIDRKGNYVFESVGCDKKFSWTVAPRSISEMHLWEEES